MEPLYQLIVSMLNGGWWLPSTIPVFSGVSGSNVALKRTGSVLGAFGTCGEQSKPYIDQRGTTGGRGDSGIWGMEVPPPLTRGRF